DAGEMKQLTAVLLDNACKYAGEGGVVRLKLAREGERLCLSVFNTGERIPPEKLDHVFERFYRADEARSEGGYGLGLAIAQRIAENHGGRITAESGEQGTTFTLTAPLKK
ncbi:MAG TPA: sensor histidine kinase, partial [Oscillospiraceae bacterium]|nr:sensor histidine kinase [Oscillospiraceae bacterium]